MAQVLIVKSRANSKVTEKMYNAAVEVLEQNRMSFDTIETPTIFEIPTAISMSIDSSDFESVICLGSVVEKKEEAFKDQTMFQIVCESLNDFGVHYIMPVGNGVMYSKSEKAALKVADSYGNSAANAALQMLKYKRQINLLEDDRHTIGKKHN